MTGKHTVVNACVILVTMFCVKASWAQEGLVARFSIAPSPIAISRTARPGAPFDRAGSRFLITGTEDGSFEAWSYPVKLLRNFGFSFLLGNSTRPIPGAEVVRYADITPEALTLTFTHQAFTIKAIFVTPAEDPGAVILLEVDSSAPVTIVCGFVPVLQPMWPAGMGGQFAYWDEDNRAYIITESSRRHFALIGSPAARGISYTPAHMLSDVPSEFRIDIPEPEKVRDRYIPVVLAGGRGKREDAIKLYQDLARDPEGAYRRSLGHFRRLHETTLAVKTPVRDLDLAFEWAKVALDGLRADNPYLGRGLVAGLGPSGTGGRPGFGWFFGGDASINSFSLNCMGYFAATRESLAFQRKWQRQDGKIAHEISQAAEYIDWFKDYPFAYIHGDTTPFYIAAAYDYYRSTGDIAFVRESWESLERAYAWCLTTDANGDGLMDNAKAGLGALEYGALTDIESDVYLSAVWVRAAEGMSRLAEGLGRKEESARAARDFEKARAAFDAAFWDPEAGQYAYAFNAAGKHVSETSPWCAVGLLWCFGDGGRSRRSLEKIGSSELTTDWGVRSISNASRYFEPLNYNYGAVWPFLNGWVSAAQFTHHFTLQGYATLLATARHTFDNAAGTITEVFSGTHNIWPQEAVPHQGFSSSGVVLPLVRGLLGIDIDAAARRITFAPQFPADWNRVAIERLAVGSAIVSLDYTRGHDTLRLTIAGSRLDGLSFRFAPVLGPGTRITGANVDGKPAAAQTLESEIASRPALEFPLLKSPIEAEIRFEPTVELLPPLVETRTGASDDGLKIISVKAGEGRLRVQLEGLSGETYRLPLAYAQGVAGVDGASLSGGGLDVSIPGDKIGHFIRHTVVIVTKKD